jgi:hypothetical protein
MASRAGLPSPLEGFPLLAAYYARFRALPTLAAYFDSPSYRCARGGRRGGVPCPRVQRGAEAQDASAGFLATRRTWLTSFELPPKLLLQVERLCCYFVCCVILYREFDCGIQLPYASAWPSSMVYTYTLIAPSLLAALLLRPLARARRS